MSHGLPRSLDDLPARHRADAERQLGAGGAETQRRVLAAGNHAEESASETHSAGPTDRPARPLRRIRQATNPKLTLTESDALEYLVRQYRTAYTFHPHAIRLQLANGCFYTPDIIGKTTLSELPFRIMAWEVKGKHAWDDSIVKLKVAAREWPSILFTLIWREYKGGQWQEQEVLP